MTDNRTLNSVEIVGSLAFTTKLLQKLVKDYPSHTPEQIADALEAAFGEKLAKAEVRLQNVEKIRQEYNALKSAQSVVVEVADMTKRLAEVEYVDHAASVTPKAAAAKKPASKANGKADPNQTALSL